MGKKVDFIMTVILTIMIITLLLVFYLYIIPSGANVSFVQKQPKQTNVPLVSEDVQQSYPNMRFNHNTISYGFHSTCTESKRMKVHKAFNILEEKVVPLNFVEAISQPDIIIDCSKEEVKTGTNTYQAGLGGPSTLNLSIYPLIVSGEVTLYGQKLECDYPVVEIHEILHVFGYNHVNNSNSIMYPYLNDCEQKLDSFFVEHLTELYSIEPKAEIYFSELDANITKGYLNFKIKITNQGLIDIHTASLKITSEKKEIKNYDLEDFEPGLTKTVSITNLRLPRSLEQLKFEIVTESKEYNKSNNIEIFELE